MSVFFYLKTSTDLRRLLVEIKTTTTTFIVQSKWRILHVFIANKKKTVVNLRNTNGCQHVYQGR